MTSILKVDEIQNTDGKTGIVITPDGSLESVKFPETTGGDPNRVITSTTMSSYEEGSWVPTIAGETTTGTGTYTTQSGAYTKIGSLVTCMGYIGMSANTGTGNLLLAGLPFTQSPTASETVGTLMSFDLTYTFDQLVLVGLLSQNYLRFFQFGQNTTWAPVPMDTSFSVQFQFTYQTDE